MQDGFEVDKLCKIYSEMDAVGREKMLAAAQELFSVQKTIKDNHKPQTRRFKFVFFCLITGILILTGSCFLWITMINPALLMSDITPPLMVRIIISALFGIIIIGTGLLRFMLRKLTVPLGLLAIGAGILCIEPGLVTDLMGIIVFILFAALYVKYLKFHKNALI